ncbi:hypothetical protein Nepgr_026574 [Nepenthes gracilis]|uniref:Uncharacterized protein n=1 Tax=Nepenthes gracilis TaxID=150966 RepID=A0AAD3T8T2_NEPGR|nr:hypothetical protein Nepgr_026574 [Nepenthes gracilis]
MVSRSASSIRMSSSLAVFHGSKQKSKSTSTAVFRSSLSTVLDSPLGWFPGVSPISQIEKIVIFLLERQGIFAERLAKFGEQQNSYKQQLDVAKIWSCKLSLFLVAAGVQACGSYLRFNKSSC